MPILGKLRPHAAQETDMFVVGVTGGIGSGKTAVTDAFADFGVTVVDADLASRIVVEPGRPALRAIADRFGPAILQADGSLDRAALRTVIFRDLAAKEWLERCLHPVIREEVQHQLAQASGPYAIFVSPLLIEAGQQTFCDRILVVDVPEEVQLQRTVIRDNNDSGQVSRIIASQAPRAKRLSAADDVIENNGTLEELREQVRGLHRCYLALATGTPARQKPLTVKCPGCGTEVIWSEASASRPFCSERCRNQDFIGWANESHSIPGDSDFDDLLSDDLPPRG